MNRLESLIRNRHKGETAIVVANGPSLNKTEFELINGRLTFGLNKIFLGFTKFMFYPTYYVAVNEIVLRQSARHISKLNCLKFLSNKAPDLYKEDAFTYILNTKNSPERFSFELADGLNEGWTVTYAALQIAYYMGIQKVVIVGLDHRYEFQGKPNEANELVGADPNHFSQDYFSGQKWNNPDLKRSEESFLIARGAFEAAGRQIIDATVGGACDIFEKRRLEDCFP